MIALLPVVVILGMGQVSDQPYARKHVDPNNSSSHCFYWPAGTVNFYQSAPGNGSTNGGTEFAAVSAAWQSWQAVMDRCGNLDLVEGPHTDSRTVGYDSVNVSANQNVVMFRTVDCHDVVQSSDSCWTRGDCGNTFDCFEHGGGTIALTTSTYDNHSGKLYDADVEFNAAKFVFTTVDSPPCTTQPYSQSCVANDVQNAMTHEAGHVIGLDHTTYPGSVMNPEASIGEISKRTIDPGSQSFVCTVYPKGQASQDCVPSPAAGCGCGTPGTGVGGFGLLALSLLYRRARRVSTV